MVLCHNSALCDICLLMHRRTISLIVPCYNEAASLDGFFARLAVVLSRHKAFDWQIVCIDDGSTDDTLACLQRHAQENPQLLVLELSRNFGKECALTAGLDFASGDAVIPIDADLQHPPELISEMLQQWQAGADVVLARRRSRETDHPLLRWFSKRFYRWHNRLAECDIPPDVGDFRLMDRRVVEALRSLPERRRFMKGLFAWVGFRQVALDYDVAPRSAGKSSFNARRLWGLALEGITSFSTVPLTVWVWLGMLIAGLAMAYGVWVVIKTLVYGIDVPGYASLLAAVLFMGGIQLIGIGVLGQYVGRIYSEAKQRPVYLVRRIYGHHEQ